MARPRENLESMNNPMSTVAVSYNYPLVALSVLLAILASYVSLELAHLAGKPHQIELKDRWLSISSLALALGIWTMHFIGMFAFKLPIPVIYDGFMTILSLLIALAGSFFGFATLLIPCPIRRTAALGGCIMGAGIAGMHYLGMHAMRVAADMHYNPFLVALSVLIAVFVSGLALWIVGSIKAGNIAKTTRNKILVAGMMGLAIASMHYLGMASVTLQLNGSTVDTHGFVIEGELMATTLSFAAILLILFPLYSVNYEHRFSDRLAIELKQLRINEARLRKLIENAPDAFFVHDENGQLLDVNKVACLQLGYTREELLSSSIFRIADKQELVKAICPSLLNTGGSQIQGTYIRKDGSTFPVEVNITAIMDNGKKYIFALARDVTETEKLKSHLSKLAMTDELTELYNRRAFISCLDKSLSRARRNAENLSVLMIDIDYFKQINDLYGHYVGDIALKHFSHTIKKSIRHEDIVGRLGGEEFAILLPNTSKYEASALAEKLRKTLEDSVFDHEEKEIGFTVSIGIACFDPPDISPMLLLKNADHALYLAKENGRNCVVNYCAAT